MKKSTIAIILLTLVFFVVVVTRFGELNLIVNSFREGIWYFLFLAFLFQVAFFAFQSEVRRSLYRILGIKERFWPMFRLTFLAMFVGTVIPLHIGGFALFLGEAKAKKYSQSRALIGSLTYFLFDYLGFILTLCLALFLLFRLGDLNQYQIIGSIVLIVFVSGATWLVFHTLEKESRIKKATRLALKLIPKKKRTKFIPVSKIDHLATNIMRAKQYFTKRKKQLWHPALMAVLTQASGVMVLVCCFLAYGLPFNFTIIITVYAMAMLFLVMAVTPYGIGTVEFIMTLTLTGFGRPLGEALLLTLTFRFFTFWVPLFFGYLSSKKVKNILLD